ncbi:hypothetical protein GR158_12065 [Shinella sp. AETb1-6]|uniref:hypothetical protein n=1 Tax=Shinella sp. AETb1-6 TaxID=2692210 RepID=UPI00136D1D13|nr:hypothetical protein [Shinella sp. AETb1-6]MXN51857.1 hypothetical protein [Shinella sp. AETb1-6]
MTSPVSAIEAIEKALDEFDREVQEQLSAESERADLWEELDVNASDLREVLSLARQAEALQRENAELREALKPFAECVPEWDGEPDSLHVFFEWNDENAPVPSLPVADFRRARALLGGSEHAE